MNFVPIHTYIPPFTIVMSTCLRGVDSSDQSPKGWEGCVWSWLDVIHIPVIFSIIVCITMAPIAVIPKIKYSIGQFSVYPVLQEEEME